MSFFRKHTTLFTVIGLCVLASGAFVAGSYTVKFNIAQAQVNQGDCPIGGNVELGRFALVGYFSNACTRYLPPPDNVNVTTGGSMTTRYTNADDSTTFKDTVRNDLDNDFSACATTNEPPGHPVNGGYTAFPDCFKKKSDAVLAAFFVMSMLGEDPANYFDSGGSLDDGVTNNDHLQGIQWAKDHYAGWADLVDDYIYGNGPGQSWVNFNSVRAYVCDGGANRASWNIRGYGKDAAWIPCSENGDANGQLFDTIVFRNPYNGAEFKIIKNCGNAKGTLSLPDYDLNSNLIATSTQGEYLGLKDGDTVQPGKKYHLKAQIKNSSSVVDARKGGQLRVRLSSDSVAARNAVTGEPLDGAPFPEEIAKTTPSVSANYGFFQQFFPSGDPAGSGNFSNPGGLPANGAASGCGVGAPGGDGAKRWCWKYHRLNRDAGDVSHTKSIEQEFTFSVAANAPLGQRFCLTSSAYIGNRADGQRDGSRWCFLIDQPAAQTYMRVYGNDVFAGGGFGTICSSINQSASIRGFATSETIGGNTNWKGASSQFGASALGGINGFFTASMRGPTGADNLPRPPLDLTFGNTLNGTSKVTDANQGGNSGISTCLPDYYAEGIANGGMELLPPQTIGTTIVGVNTPLHDAKYVNGDVYINGTGIRFKDADGSWGNLVDNIPSFHLIVKGNIYIDPEVEQLDGVYVAQPTPPTTANGPWTKGEIITCANDQKTTPSTGCNKKLTINGAFIARQVRFKRTFGNLAAASATETAANSQAAEVFNFSPEVYLSPLGPGLNRSVPFTKYDYITSLPPVL